MKKSLKILVTGVFALFVFVSCNDDIEVSPNESYFASEATITSSDSNVTITGNEAEVTFKVEGGTVTFTVDCGCEWKATSYKPEYFTATTTSTSVTITAVQNTVENELAGVVSLMTAGESIQFARIQVHQNAYGAPEITVSTNEWNAPAVGALTTEISVTASDEWDIENTAEWLTVEKTGTGVSLAATENEETEERVARVVLTCTDGIRSDSETITVTQDGRAYITLSEGSLAFEGEAATASVTVESNYDLECGSSADWLKVSISGNTLSVDVTDNDTGEAREGIVTLTAGDGAENVAEAQLSVSQGTLVNEDALILVYTTTGSNQEIELPIAGTVNCTIDWGDGSEIETCTSGSPTHTYASPGEYSVVIDGTVTSLYSRYIDDDKRSLLTGVTSFGHTGLTDVLYAFYCCSNLVDLPSSNGGAFANVGSYSDAFYGCSSLKELPAGLLAGAPNAIGLHATFYECTSLEVIPADLFTGCTGVQDIEYLFYGCTSLKEVPAGIFDDLESATYGEFVFQNCSSLKTIPAGLFAHCPLINSLKSAFNGCSSLEAIPEKVFDGLTSLNSLYQAFLNCSSLKTIASGVFDTLTAITTFEDAFDGCTSLETIPSGLFDKCTEVTSFKYTFEKCSALTEVPVGLFDNCKKVTDFQYTFFNCTSLKTIPEGLFADQSNCTTFYGTFYGCSSLETAPSNLFSGCSANATFYYTFCMCSSLKNLGDDVFKGCTAASNFTYTFGWCDLLELPARLFSDCTAATLISGTFYDNENLKVIPDGLFDNCTAVTNFSYCFSWCLSLEAIPEELFDNCTSAQIFTQCFYNCPELKTIPAGLFSKNLKATQFMQTFAYCKNVTGESPYTLLSDGTKVHLYERGSYTSEGFSRPTIYTQCFYNCTQLDDWDAINAAGWGGEGN